MRVTRIDAPHTLDIQVGRVTLRFCGQDLLCGELFVCNAISGRNVVVLGARLSGEQACHGDGFRFLCALLRLWRVDSRPLGRRLGYARWVNRGHGWVGLH